MSLESLNSPVTHKGVIIPILGMKKWRHRELNKQVVRDPHLVNHTIGPEIQEWFPVLISFHCTLLSHVGLYLSQTRWGGYIRWKNRLEERQRQGFSGTAWVCTTLSRYVLQSACRETGFYGKRGKGQGIEAVLVSLGNHNKRHRRIA